MSVLTPGLKAIESSVRRDIRCHGSLSRVMAISV